MPIADYKQFLNLRANRPFHLGYYPAKAARAVAPDPTDGMPNAAMLTCGDCDLPYLMHPVTDPFGDSICARPLSSFHIDSDRDYYADTFLTVKDSQPAPYYDEDDSEPTSVSIDYDYALDTWRDEHPVVHYRVEIPGEKPYYTIVDGEFTSALDWTYGNLSGTYAPTSQQAIGNLPTNVGVPNKGKALMLDVPETFDAELTERLALRQYLNYYVDKNTGDTRLGGLVLSREGSIFRAKCVRNDWTTNRCNAPILSIDTSTFDRDKAETFVLDLIRHSNNHAATWFTKRSTFYKVHHQDCDLLCDPNAAHCDVSAALERKIALLADQFSTHHTTLKVAS